MYFKVGIVEAGTYSISQFAAGVKFIFIFSIGNLSLHADSNYIRVAFKNHSLFKWRVISFPFRGFKFVPAIELRDIKPYRGFYVDFININRGEYYLRACNAELNSIIKFTSAEVNELLGIRMSFQSEVDKYYLLH